MFKNVIIICCTSASVTNVVFCYPGAIMLDLDQTTLPGIAHLLVETMIISDQIRAEDRPNVLRALLLKHRLVEFTRQYSKQSSYWSSPPWMPMSFVTTAASIGFLLSEVMWLHSGGFLWLMYFYSHSGQTRIGSIQRCKKCHDLLSLPHFNFKSFYFSLKYKWNIEI